MKRLLTLGVAATLLAIVLAGCASDPKFDTGKVIDKHYQPDKEWNAIEYSPNCGFGFDGKYTCGKFKLQNVHHHQHEAHRLRIENCQLSDKSGNTIVKKDGSAKCFSKWIDVDETTYGRYHKGDNYEN